MHVGFDNTARLRRRIYYFEYRGVRFKLIQSNPRQWSDVLLTILPSSEDVGADNAYATAGEFLSALSWQNHSNVTLQEGGGINLPSPVSLKAAKCRSFGLPEVFHKGNVRGYEISVLPHVENEEQRLALALFREARSSNKALLAFLLHWQVMEVAGGDPVKWVNAARYQRPRPIRVDAEELKELSLGGRRLGDYFQEDCRNATAHIRRWTGRRVLAFDQRSEDRRMRVSAKVVERFAEDYIRNALKLTKTVTLVRVDGRGFPRYMDQASRRRSRITLAYR